MYILETFVQNLCGEFNNDKQNGVFTGESVSMVSPVSKFILKERVEDDILYVSEVFYEDNKKTFGFEDPIIYKRAGNL
ncbi:MAG TPA: hypothetical protein DDY58_12940 [Terrisporobacter glycolicus]|uniref:hypothetical protein n=1 Tax=Terrisporobacter TaxID=1505652 RepID=UPI000E97BDC2|nr:MULTISPECIES: hypothetical protein [Terrisporobacter]HBI93241.1 hypothetical protein [Terrisporobacter hibernicus]